MERVRNVMSTRLLVCCLRCTLKLPPLPLRRGKHETRDQAAKTYINSSRLLLARPYRAAFPTPAPLPHQPSLLPLVDFLVNVFGWRLPQETCVGCDKKVLPDDPRGPSLKDPAHKDRPTRQALQFPDRGVLIRTEWSRTYLVGVPFFVR